MLAKLETESVTLRTDHQIGRERAVEELRDTLVGIRVTDLPRFNESLVDILRRMAARRCGLQLFRAGGDARMALIADRVLADLLDDRKFQPVAAQNALEADQATACPHFVRPLPAGNHQVDLIADVRIT